MTYRPDIAELSVGHAACQFSGGGWHHELFWWSVRIDEECPSIELEDLLGLGLTYQ
jgi:hypothetical protein